MFKVKSLNDFYDVDELKSLKSSLEKFKTDIKANKEYLYSYPSEHYDEVTNIGANIGQLIKADGAASLLIAEIDDNLKYMG